MIDFLTHFDNSTDDDNGIWVWDGEKWIRIPISNDAPEEDW